MKILIAIVVLLSRPLSVWAQEAIVLTTPIVTTTTKTQLLPVSLEIRVRPTPRILVTLVVANTEEVFAYPCSPFPSGPPNPCTIDTEAEVLTLMTALNTANLSTRSLWHRVMDRLILDFPSRFPGGATVQ